MTTTTPKISVVIPVKNEEDNILPLLKEIHGTLTGQDYEVIYVDDGSTDNSLSVLKREQQQGDKRLRILTHANSCGQSTAVYLGVQAAKGELIATLDGDGQNDPADIPAMLEMALQYPKGAHFCIAGYRKRRHDSAWKLMQSRIANGIRSRVLGDDTPDTGCGLKVFPRQTFLALPYFDHMHRFLPALVKRCGGQIRVSEVNHRARHAGISKYNMLNRAWVGLVDMFGVMWLQRRNRLPVQSQECLCD
ncbi:glycosyltransferase family 2 protein [Aliiglaciecola sp. CAU 1673]|uniref:glycosyltransferase family 2 protein n=1 Tax=Aliiglaciecola sp. CAU 1673 TaxID=3032595 RepID=UPI0023DBE822|nr:glycosyltransferase family 2 protein [Aliiglaciecola sp. CAU 1673]MDF2177279.1 glycosyltransferase family 2 protein [Aliiglaciecola sp. CAU 1673]